MGIRFGDTIMAYVRNGVLCNADDFANDREASEAKGIPISMDIGMRIYRDTLAFLFEVSANNALHFKKNLMITSSIGDGYYFLFKEGGAPSESEIISIDAEMRRLVAEGKTIRKIRVESSKAISVLKGCGMDWSAALVDSLGSPSVELQECCGTYTLSTTFIADSFKNITSFELRKYHDGFLLRFPRRGTDGVDSEWKDNEVLFRTISDDIRNSDVLSIDSIGHLNSIISENGLDEYIEVSENLQRRKIIEVSDQILAKGDVKAVFVAGPSSSNKTTFANRLCRELKVLGYHPMQISLDDYYFTKDKVPKNEFGEPDVECLESIDVELFKSNLKDLYDGKEVYLPHFEFNFNKVGRRTFSETPSRLGKNNILVIEGIHALNSKLTESLSDDAIFKIYISPLVQLNLDEYNRIRSTDLRLLRRLVRDFKKRGASALETLSMWPAVERGERKYIFPFQNDADAMLNSAHSYEIGVLSVYAIPLLRSIRESDDLSCYITARRLLSLLANVNPIPSELVPETSMLQEFIG